MSARNGSGKAAAATHILGLLLALTGCGREAPAPAAAGAARSATLDGIDEATIAELGARMQRGELSAEALTAHYLARIAAVDQAGPQLRAVIEINPDALAIARALDAERAAGRLRGPLHGMPVLVKDNIDSADRMATSAGSLALANHHAREDAEVVRRLREAGAVLLGKTNLSEWANFRSSRSTSGWSARGGQTRNPYDLARNPCGSSSGSAVAVAANLAVVSVGTETDGSIICPASANGIVGLKPTLGRVSRRGIVPIAHSQDTAGPMARTVADAALLLAVLAGSDARDAATAEAGARSRHDDASALLQPDIRGLRIGVVRARFGFDPDVDALMEQAIAALRELGAVVIDPVQLPNDRDYDDAELLVLLHEFKVDLAVYLAGVDPALGLRGLDDLIAFNERESARELALFGQELFVQSANTNGLGDAKYLEALANAKRLAGPLGIDAALDDQRLDALLAPSGGPAWLTDPAHGDRYAGGSSSPAAVAGYPNVTVPAGQVRGLPVGVSFFGRAWSEPTLLRIAAAYEQATRHRASPRLSGYTETRVATP